MIKAYLYPQFDIVDNWWYDENPARIEVTIPVLPVKGMDILIDPIESGILQDFYFSCLRQLLKPSSVICCFITELRKNIEKGEEKFNGGYNSDYFKGLSDVDLLKEYFFGHKLYYGFDEGIWLVKEVHIAPNDEYVHIDIEQEI